MLKHWHSDTSRGMPNALEKPCLIATWSNTFHRDWPEIEPGPPRWETGDWPHGRSCCVLCPVFSSPPGLLAHEEYHNGRSRWDTCVLRSLCKVPVFFVQLWPESECVTNFSRNPKYEISWRHVLCELRSSTQLDGTYMHDKANNRFLHLLYECTKKDAFLPTYCVLCDSEKTVTYSKGVNHMVFVMERVCFLWGRNGIFKYNLSFRPQWVKIISICLHLHCHMLVSLESLFHPTKHANINLYL